MDIPLSGGTGGQYLCMEEQKMYTYPQVFSANEEGSTYPALLFFVF